MEGTGQHLSLHYQHRKRDYGCLSRTLRREEICHERVSREVNRSEISKQSFEAGVSAASAPWRSILHAWRYERKRLEYKVVRELAPSPLIVQFRFQSGTVLGTKALPTPTEAMARSQLC